ncbi:MAG: hypothetical protein CV045_14155, partial [Cyanobacteria bacterium M5B4]
GCPRKAKQRRQIAAQGGTAPAAVVLAVLRLAQPILAAELDAALDQAAQQQIVRDRHEGIDQDRLCELIEERKPTTQISASSGGYAEQIEQGYGSQQHNHRYEQRKAQIAGGEIPRKAYARPRPRRQQHQQQGRGGIGKEADLPTQARQLQCWQQRHAQREQQVQHRHCIGEQRAAAPLPIQEQQRWHGRKQHRRQ